MLQLNNLGDVDKASLENFKSAAQVHLSAGSSDLSRICKEIKKMGPPAYHPTYMIQHGMASLAGADDGIKQDFDSGEAWAESLKNYLHCAM
jgi:hypothetical protein